jgi:hypothetical protein
MRRRPRSKTSPHKQSPTGWAFATSDIRFMLSNPVYAYAINQQPVEHGAEEVTQLNTRLAQAVRATGTMFTLGDLDQRFQALLLQLEDTGVCHSGVPSADHLQGTVAAGAVGHDPEAGE